MARYTRSLSIALPLGDCFKQLKVVLEDCNFQMLFSKEDCIIAQEKPGQVPFAKLVTIEVLVDSTRATSNVTAVDIVVKNEELPLQSNNHCYQIFNQLDQSLNQYSGWQVIGKAANPTQTEHSHSPISSYSPVALGSSPRSTSLSSDGQSVSQPTSANLSIDTDQLAPLTTGMAKQPRSYPHPIVNMEPLPLPRAVNPSLQQIADSEPLLQPDNADSSDLGVRVQTRDQMTAPLEEVQHQRPDSAANLERLRQKHSDSIANLAKIRQKREHLLTTTLDGDRVDSPGDDLNQWSM